MCYTHSTVFHQSSEVRYSICIFFFHILNNGELYLLFQGNILYFLMDQDEY